MEYLNELLNMSFLQEILLKDEVNELNILKLSDQNNTYSAIKEINNLSNTIASIKEKIKESM